MVFGLLIVEELPVDDPRVQTVLSTIVLTVLLSVILHGISGRPLTMWMRGHHATSDESEGEMIRPASALGHRQRGAEG